MANENVNVKEKILSNLGSGLNSINSKLDMVENALDGKHLLKDKIQIVEGKLKEELIELSSNVATIKTLIETLLKGQREILDLENREVPNDGY
jgi:hypothetical protein